jgi:hypothetical protein
MNTHLDMKTCGWAPSVGYVLTMVGGLAIAAIGCREGAGTTADKEEQPAVVRVDELPDVKNPAPVEQAARDEVARAVPGSAASLQLAPVAIRGAATAGKAPTAAVGVTSASAAAELALKPATLKVKRFVVAPGVEAREPLSFGATLPVGEPVYAFAELVSGKGAPAVVEIVFEHEGGRKVGHAKLEVPADQPRWRTWGQSRNINRAGRWTAVLLDGEQVELARTEFTVAAPDVVAPAAVVPQVVSPNVVAPEVAVATETSKGG